MSSASVVRLWGDSSNPPDHFSSANRKEPSNSVVKLWDASSQSKSHSQDALSAEIGENGTIYLYDASKRTSDKLVTALTFSPLSQAYEASNKRANVLPVNSTPLTWADIEAMNSQ